MGLGWPCSRGAGVLLVTPSLYAGRREPESAPEGASVWVPGCTAPGGQAGSVRHARSQPCCCPCPAAVAAFVVFAVGCKVLFLFN